MVTPPSDVYRYRVTELLGRGGFAKVYRALQEGPDGVVQDVAIKILNETEPPADVLQRFRDESRILGLVRDRAVVSVEPATQLGGHWAVIMEYVPGASCRALLKHRGTFPSRVALEIVQEVARALERLYHVPGPDGLPLHLVHRDVKPGNIQITRAGEVKILDFGVARARFESREAHTTRAIQGTYGYIAPERLQGLDTPAADTFSLGMVLFKLITGGPTERKLIEQASAATRGAEGHALKLAAEMCHLEYGERPSLQEVFERCGELVSRMEGPRLEEWAEIHVPAHIGTADDPLCGKVLVPDPPEGTPVPAGSLGDRGPRKRQDRLLLLASLTGFNVVLAVVALLAVGGGAWAYLVGATEGWSLPSFSAEAETPIGLEPVPVAPPPAPVAAQEEPAAAPSVKSPPTAAPPAAAPPAVAAANVPTVACSFGSQPLGADVYLDGKLIGVTPILEYHVPHGAHQLEMRLSNEAASMNLLVGKRTPTRFVWKRGERWEVLY